MTCRYMFDPCRARSTLQHTATRNNTMQRTATHCSTCISRIQIRPMLCTVYTATHCNTLQHLATQCNTLQQTTTHCNTLQRTAMHCNTLRHTAAYESPENVSSTHVVASRSGHLETHTRTHRAHTRTVKTIL